MNRLKIAIAALFLAALPLAGSAEDAPGVFKIPGTESTIKFYGYVQLDATADFSGRAVNYEEGDWATILPLVPDDDSAYSKNAKPQLYMTARTSRFGIQTSTPTKMGNVGVRLEGDFNGPNGFQSEGWTNSVLFRLRHAYGTVGNLLVGQTWTTFLDFGGAPETVDFNGPGTLALVRSPMIRYTLPLGEGMTLALAAENIRGPQFSQDGAGNPDPRFQTIPDLHANFTWSGSQGSLSLRAVTLRYNVAALNGAGAPVDQSPESGQGFGFAASGSYKLGAADSFQAQFAGGPGIGRYLFNTIATGAFTFNSAGNMEMISAYGAHLGWGHTWTPEIRTNLVGAYSWVVDPKVDGGSFGPGNQEKFVQAFGNVFWSFAKNAEFGVEYAYGQWESFGPNSVKGTQNRLNASFHYNFF